MDWLTAIVGLISMLLFVVPFVIMYYNSKKKENNMLLRLKENAQQNECKISQHEFCGNFVLGIDEGRNFVFFFKKKKEEAISQFIDLAEIKSCHVVLKTRNSDNDKGNHSIIERVELSFSPKNISKGEVRFELYDEEINMRLNGELQFVDKWANQINDRLRYKK